MSKKQRIIILVLLIASSPLFYSCAQLGLGGKAGTEDGELISSSDDISVMKTPVWYQEEFYKATETEITVYGQGISSDSLAAVQISKENAVANYRMALMDIQLQENGYSANVNVPENIDFPESSDAEVFEANGVYRSFVKAIFKR